MSQITRRTLTPEHMDEPGAGRAEIDEALRYIRMVNRRLGGTHAAIGHLEQWSRNWNRGETIRILDIGTGSADIPLAIVAWAARAGHRVHITAVDLHPVTIELAREHVQGCDAIEVVQADALRLMDTFAAGSFDYAHAGMFLHHLADIDVMTVLRIMDRLTKRGLIWNDLVRGFAGRVGVRVMTIGTAAIVRHDAIVSVEAGFTKAEAMDLAARAGVGRTEYRRHMLHRFTLTARKV